MSDNETMQLDYLSKLKNENAAMEEELARLTAKPIASTARAPPSSAADSRMVRVMNFGTSSVADEAGKDHGSSWCPPQCSRRTALGGFHTS